MDTSKLPSIDSITDPIIHDQSNVIRVGDPRTLVSEVIVPGDPPFIDWVYTEDRKVNGATSGSTQRTMGFDNGSMTTADTYRFITWTPRDAEQLGKGTALDPRTLGNKTGTVNMQEYLTWLNNHGYFN
jgi:hypothetical protein